MRFTLATIACALAIAPAAAQTTGIELPSALVPAGLSVYLTVPATGVQIYTCGKNDAGAPTWVFKAPEAQLFDTDKKQIGKHYAGPTWEALAGGKVVGEEYTPFGVKDFTSTIRKIDESGAKILVLDVVGADAITFAKQFTAAGMKAKCKFAWLGYSENYLPGLTKDESEGIVTVANFISTLNKPEAKAFVSKVKARFGDTAIVSNTVDAHYMLTRFFIEGIKRANSVDKEQIINHVTGFSLQSGNGMVRLRPEDRHADLNVVIAETRNQRLVLVKDIGLVKASNQCQKS